MPNKFGRTVIFGSGAGDEHVVKNASAQAKPEDIMMQLLFGPLILAKQMVDSFFGIEQKAEKPAPLPGGMGPRKFTQHGELVQNMGTSTLDRMNIFGAGGSS